MRGVAGWWQDENLPCLARLRGLWPPAAPRGRAALILRDPERLTTLSALVANPGCLRLPPRGDKESERGAGN